MIRKLLKLAHMLDEGSTHIIGMTGFVIVTIFTLVSFTYLRGQLVMVDGKASIDITGLVTGKIAYIWVGLISAWVTAKVVHYGFHFRNWWVHSDSHKIKLPIMRRGISIR